MTIKSLGKKVLQNYVLQTLITVCALCMVFLALVTHLYNTAKEDAYENLHIQTKQIKDNITLQLISDRENLTTMASFAAKLYGDGEDYSMMFESFKPIGLIKNIGILTADNVFVTKAGSVDLNGLISFEEEAQRGAYISGRVKDLTVDDHEIIRSAVPILVNGKTVGVLYGVISLDEIGERYSRMAQEYDAQLFVYDSATGDLVIDTIHEKPDNISFLKDRVYNDHYSYEEMMAAPKGFTSFQSAYKDENMHLHYSQMKDIGWTIAMARYDSQVFAGVNTLTNAMMIAFAMMTAIITVYVVFLVYNERQLREIASCASDIRKILLETTENHDQIEEAMKLLCHFVKGRSVVFFDTDGEQHNYIDRERVKSYLDDREKQFVMTQLLRYAGEFQDLHETTVAARRIRCDKLLEKENAPLYQVLNKHQIREISFSATISNRNHTVILAVLDAKRGDSAKELEKRIAACFSMALHNRIRYDQTKREATTDALTATWNRVAYNRDLQTFDLGNTKNFSCIYVDVNELHLRNNLYGHAAGDEMLVFIANALKEVFCGQKVYRMGGDEFLVFCRDMAQEDVARCIAMVHERLAPKDYHVSVGLSYRRENANINEMVKEAEHRMYEDKARYYQNKEGKNIFTLNNGYVHLKTGLPEIDTLLANITNNYNGIYRVSLDTDYVKRVLMPTAFNYGDADSAIGYSQMYSKYVSDAVHPEDYRAMMSALNYDALDAQLRAGHIPRIRYKRNDGCSMVMSIYRVGDGENPTSDTLWVFENKGNNLDKGRSL